MPRICPLGDRAVVKPTAKEEITKSGIVEEYLVLKESDILAILD